MDTVAIVGVGLIGGSFALALRRAGFSGELIGVSSPRTIAEALEAGVIDRALPLQQAAAAADLIYLSQPISGILETIAKLDPLVKDGALITDAGSTKARIAEQARRHIRRAQFLGGHPMAGKETRGPAAAEADLFQDRTYVLTPSEPAALESAAAQELIGWIRRFGARLLYLAPEQHDRTVAFVSHLPQLASTALAAMLGDRGDLPALDQAAGPGLVDTTRLALSPFEIWGDILATNAADIQEALAAYIDALADMRAALSQGGAESRFESGAAFASRLRRDKV
ncbi:MAG: prephenate dehydrogenase/arogenate dehydrogenase family protein [Bryobacteraceae bacterium]|nr:prephenate dehydrogenase/arogenate dehydrogenase family protein [Bryobacteraceae bacterium]